MEKKILTLNGITDRDLGYILKYGKPKNSLCGYESKKLIYLPYGLIRKDIPIYQKTNRHDDVVIEILKAQHGNDIDLSAATPNDSLAFYLFVKKELEYIQKLEELHLASEPDIDMVGAGIHNLNELGVLPTIHALAGGSVLKHREIEATPYYEIYQVLKLEKIQRDINRRYNEIIAAKNKTK